MTTSRLPKLLQLQGRTVGVALHGGDRIDECQLVALPLKSCDRFWLSTGREDRFVMADEVLDVWEVAPARG